MWLIHLEVGKNEISFEFLAGIALRILLGFDLEISCGTYQEDLLCILKEFKQDS